MGLIGDGGLYIGPPLSGLLIGEDGGVLKPVGTRGALDMASSMEACRFAMTGERCNSSTTPIQPVRCCGVPGCSECTIGVVLTLVGLCFFFFKPSVSPAGSLGLCAEWWWCRYSIQSSSGNGGGGGMTGAAALADDFSFSRSLTVAATMPI